MTEAEIIAAGGVPIDGPTLATAATAPKKYSQEELSAMGAVPVEEPTPSIGRKAGELGLKALDVVGSATRPLVDVPIALSQIPAGVVEYFRGKRPGQEIAGNVVSEVAKGAAYGPLRALTTLTGGSQKDIEQFKPAGFEKTLGMVGVPEKMDISLPARDEMGHRIDTLPDVPSTVTRKGLGTVLDIGADLAISRGLQGYLAKKAPRLAETATMVAPSYAAKFKPGTGEKLLEEGIVKFGATPENILFEASKKQGEAGRKIGASLEALDAMGAPKVTKSEIIQKLRDKANTLIKEKADMDTADGLRKIASGIESELHVPDEMTLGYANKLASEQGRKGKFVIGEYNPNAKAEARNLIRKHLEEKAGTLAGKSEDAAAALADLKNASKDFSIYKPVTEGLKKRVKQLQQQQMLGFYDTTSAIAGAAAGGSQGQTPGERIKNALIGGIAAPMLRRAVAPRATSSVSSLFNMGSKVPAIQSVNPTQRLLDLYNEP